MKALQLHLVLAMVAVFAAIGARRHAAPQAREATGIALVECAPQRVVLLQEQRSVTVAPSDDGIVVTVEAGDGEVRFVGGRSAGALLEELAELHALRSFVAEPDVDYGFGDARLRIRCPERALEWALGASPPGSADRYLREGDTVHLVAAGPIRALEEAEVRLMRRALHDFDEAELARVELTFPGGSTLPLVQRFGDDPNRRRWVDPAAPDERVPAFDRLMGAHRNLRADAGAEDPHGEPLGTLAFESDDAPLGTLELVRSGEGPAAVYLVRTDALGWVRVPRSTGAAFARAITRLQPQ